MDLIIAGDVVPTSINEVIFKKGLKKEIDKDYDMWKASDFRIFNLECPIIENGKPILKYGPNISCSNDCINGIKDLIDNKKYSIEFEGKYDKYDISGTVNFDLNNKFDFEVKGQKKIYRILELLKIMMISIEVTYLKRMDYA